MSTRASFEIGAAEKIAASPADAIFYLNFRLQSLDEARAISIWPIVVEMRDSESEPSVVVSRLWTALSLASTTLVAVGCYWPRWLSGEILLNGRRHAVFFGAARRCHYPIYDEVGDGGDLRHT